MVEPLPLSKAAKKLGVKTGTLRRWVREGCPVARLGRRGRGHALLVDPDAVLRWRKSNDDAVLLALASSIPHVLAEASVQAWRMVEGPDKRRLAGITAASWYVMANAVQDHLRTKCPDIPEIGPNIPEQIERLRKIAQE